MARIRSIHPGLWTDEAFASLSMAARVLIMGIWNHADDGGGFEWKPLTLKMRIFPVDNVEVSALLDELVLHNVVQKYDVSGKSYGAVRNFGKFQRPKKPDRFCPMPASLREYSETTSVLSKDERNQSGTSTENLDDCADVVPNQLDTGSEPVPNQYGKVSAEGRKGGREEGNNSSLRSESEGALAPLAPAKPAQRRKSQLPEDWQPSPDELAYAQNLGLDGSAVAENFRLHWRAKGETKLDWHAAFQLWCRREQSFSGARTVGSRTNPRPKTAADRADEHAAYMLEKYAGGSR